MIPDDERAIIDEAIKRLNALLIDRDALRVAITAPQDFDLRPGAVNRVEDGGLASMIYKRIEIGPPDRPRVDQRDVVEAPSSYSPAYADAVWQAVVATARGTCGPISQENG